MSTGYRNFFIIEVLDSRTLVTINDTEIVFENHPLPSTSAGESFEHKLCKEVLFRWVRVELDLNDTKEVLRDKGELKERNPRTVYGRRYVTIDGPDEEHPKIALLKFLQKEMHGEGCEWYDSDFIEAGHASEVVHWACEQGFLDVAVVYQNPRDDDDEHELGPQELEEVKGTGKWHHPDTGKAIQFTQNNGFFSLFRTTQKLVRAATGVPEPVTKTEFEIIDRVEQAKEFAYREIKLWLQQVAQRGRKELRGAALEFAAALGEKAFKKGNFLEPRAEEPKATKVQEVPQTPKTTQMSKASSEASSEQETANTARMDMTPQEWDSMRRFWGK